MIVLAVSEMSQGEYFSERNSSIAFFVLHKVFEICLFRVGIQDFAVPSQEGPDWYIVLVTPLGVAAGPAQAADFDGIHNFVSLQFFIRMKLRRYKKSLFLLHIL